MSVSGSISRKRVGSVSQRGADSPLPPLDIQSIQMPLNPQNALALKTAALSSTKSLYQTCSHLRRRLRCVEDFSPFLEQPFGAEPLDVVSHMCHTFRLGSPLCHLYNLLIPSFTDPESPLHAEFPPPKQIEYDFPAFYESQDGIRNWAKRTENAKTCQKYIAMFCMAMKQRQSEGRWHGEIWALHELWGKSHGNSDEDVEAYDSTGLMKVLHTVEAILDNLPESAMSPLSPVTPYTAGSSIQPFSSITGAYAGPSRGHLSRQSYDLPFSMGGNGPGSAAVANMAATMNGGVHIASPVSMGGEDMLRNQSKSSADANAYKSVEELVSSEKSYVQELEILVRCSTEMLEAQLVSNESNHVIFSNLSKILEFHRKFLIKLETEYEPIQEGRGSKAWAEGRWGRPFCSSESEFACYGPYCANYLEAIKLVNECMPSLIRGQELPESQRPCLDPQRELQAFMIKPIQRITKYGLLLDAILHATAKHDYPYRAELEDGYAAVKRIAANINEVTDLKAKQATVQELLERVEDWKGHEVDKFGDLWLDDHFTVTKADSPRDYHVFLFEKMMLCCKEVVPERGSKKSGKNSSMLRKDKTASKSGMPEKKRLALKGRIFVSNINRATVMHSDPNGESIREEVELMRLDPYATPKLVVAWTVPQRQANGWHEDIEDSFVMIGKSEDQVRKWGEKIMELAAAERKRQEESRAERLRQNGRVSGSDRYQQSTFAPPTPAGENTPFQWPPAIPPTITDEDEDGLRSGRTTPSMGSSGTYIGGPSSRRVQSHQSAPPDRQAELRARAMTEDQFGPSMTQWRSQQPMPPPLPRLTSAMSAMSTTSESSFGGPRSGRLASGSRLGRYDEVEEEPPVEQREAFNRYGPSRGMGMSRAPSQGTTPTVPYPHPAALRNRSASSPNVYQNPLVSPAPPLPQTATWQSGGTETFSNNHNSLAASTSSTLIGSGTGGTAYFNKRMSGSGGKRSSGESHSTETSETSSQQSPATPYGTVPSDPRGATPVSRQNSQDAVPGMGEGAMTVLVKVRCGEDQFIIGVPGDINFTTLYQKVHKKIRLCTRSASVAESIVIKWIDADEDEITIKCDADIEAMLGEVKDSGINYVNLVAR